MKIKNINLEKYIGKKVVILNVTRKEDTALIGKTGNLTNPFACFGKGAVGVFLDNAKGLNIDICNLQKNDEVNIIKKRKV